ncbi:GspH/FimT family pseudopilin [Endothiovibrio diazotrophicus]
MNRIARGFTLIELVVTLALVAMIAAFGVPMFERLIVNNRLTAQANDFLSTLLFARTEAVKRGVTITVCKSGDGASCTTNGGWDQGWIAFTDSNGLANAVVDSNETIVRTGNALPTVYSLTGTTNVQNSISYLPTGRTQTVGGNTQNGTLTLSHNLLSNFQRQITLSRTGRAEVRSQ